MKPYKPEEHRVPTSTEKEIKPSALSIIFFFFFFSLILQIFFLIQMYDFWAMVSRHNVPSATLLLPPWASVTLRACFYLWQSRFERATRSLATFIRSHHLLYSLAPQRSALPARSVHGLAHSLRSLPRGTVEIHESVFTLRTRSMGTNAIIVVTRNTP